MRFSNKEQSVIKVFDKLKVVKKATVCQELNVSHMTVVRAMEKFGYYSSINHNSLFYTLQNIPEFNNYGLWFFKDIVFSKYRNIKQTIVSMIDNSPEGYSEKELSGILHTQTSNILSRLVGQHQLSKIQNGRKAVYVSHKPGYKAKQMSNIAQKNETGDYHCSNTLFPENVEARIVIATLVRLIEKPASSVASLSLVLQGKGLKVTANEIRKIIIFYGLEKKTVQ